MTKEVYVAGALALVCLVLVATAFLAAPGHKPVEAHSDVAETTSTSDAPDAPGPAPVTHPSTVGTFTGNPGGTGVAPYPDVTSPASSASLPPAGLGPSVGLGPTVGPGQGFGPSTPAPGMGERGPSAFQPPPPRIEHPQVEPAPVEDSGTARTHIVAANETLAEISQQYYNTHRYWKKILQANPGVDADALHVGQKLVIPPLSAVQSGSHGASTGPAPEAGPGERLYTVQGNDSYYRIAQHELGDASRWHEIETLNHIPPEELHVGAVIRLPARESAPATEPTASAESGGGKIHVVAAGETLSDISKQYYGTTSHWRAILNANKTVDPDNLRVGEKLVIPEVGSTGGAGTSAATGTAPPASGGSHIYTVKAGDKLPDIAQRELGNRGAWRRILELNPGVDPRHLHVGQHLRLPGGEDTGSGEPTAAPAHPAPSTWTPFPASTPATTPAPAPSAPSPASHGTAPAPAMP